MTTISEGSCLCGAVAFEVQAPLDDVLHCHCRMCQKGHGAVYATFVKVPHTAFLLTRGADEVATYRSSDAAYRTFCRNCGSTLQFVRDERADFCLAVSALDTPLPETSIREIYTDSKTDWLTRTG